MSDSRFEGRERVLVPGTLRGYRAWRRNLGNGPVKPLQSLCVGGRNWHRRGVVVAECMYASAVNGLFHENGSLAATEPAPASGCGCGFWATYDFLYHEFVIGGFHMFSEGDSGRWVLAGLAQGSIKASGRILLGTRGFRAEKMEIEALWGKGSKRVAKWYGVPWLPTKKEFLEAFPPPNVDELILERANGPRPGL